MNYYYPPGNVTIPMYVGPNEMGYEPNMAPQSQSSQAEKQDPNAMYRPQPQYSHMNPPYFGNPVVHPQTMYPYMMPQYHSMYQNNILTENEMHTEKQNVEENKKDDI